MPVDISHVWRESANMPPPLVPVAVGSDVVSVPMVDQTSRGAAIARIEDILYDVMESCLDFQPLQIPFRKTTWSGNAPARWLHFPARSLAEARKFGRSPSSSNAAQASVMKLGTR